MLVMSARTLLTMTVFAIAHTLAGNRQQHLLHLLAQLWVRC